MAQLTLCSDPPGCSQNNWKNHHLFLVSPLAQLVEDDITEGRTGIILALSTSSPILLGVHTASALILE